MAFPYSQGYTSSSDVPLRRQTYHSGAAPMKVQANLTNGVGRDDALVESTGMAGKSASLRQGNTSGASYRVEHLASFQHEVGKAENTPATALARLKKIKEDGDLWTQVMNMKVSTDSLIMSNGETMEVIETYHVSRINQCTHILQDADFPHLFIFSTKSSSEKVGAIHLFRCRSGEADIISSEINQIVDVKAKPMSGAVVNGGYEEVDNANGHGSPELNRDSSKHFGGVSQRVEAFQKIAESPPTSANVTRTSSKNAADYPYKELEEAKVNRDVEILNRCIDEIESFIASLKTMNEARRKLSQKGRRKSMKKKYDHVRMLAGGPSEASLTDIYQKFKFCFNLLARLRSHISKPNAPELVHYLMVPLDIIVKVNGLKSAQSVLNPWLTTSAIDFLLSCLSSKEVEFWRMLGPNWNLPQSAPEFEDKHAIAYFPIFKDGWIPPDIVFDDRNAAAAKSAAQMVARMKIVEEKEELKKKTATDETKAVVVAEPQVVTVLTPTPKKQEVQAPVGTGTGKYAAVVYDYWAHNNKELTIRAGEKVLVMDDTRRWWLVRNDHNEEGYVPSTVLEFVTSDKNSDSSSADGSVSSTQSPSGTYFSGSGPIDLAKVQRLNSEPSSPTVVTARSIITESSQFSSHPTSHPSSPREPPPAVSPKPRVADEGVPIFTPPPPIAPPIVTAPSPIVIKRPPQVKEKPQAVQSEPQTLQSELNSRLNLKSPSTPNGNSLQTSDGVDFFIPLFKSSTADDVSRWLRKLGFEPITVERLKGITAKDLFKMPAEELVQRLGEDEALLLYNELQAQVGSQTRHKTMTEFQKALVIRMNRQEIIQKNVKQHHVVVKSPSGGGPSLSQEDMQKKFLEQQAMLKSTPIAENGGSDRQPEKPSFTSFTGPSSQNNNEFDFTASPVVDK